VAEMTLVGGFHFVTGQFTSHKSFLPDDEYARGLDNFVKGCSDMLITNRCQWVVRNLVCKNGELKIVIFAQQGPDFDRQALRASTARLVVCRWPHDAWCVRARVRARANITRSARSSNTGYHW
jgi:hypothetical protein